MNRTIRRFGGFLAFFYLGACAATTAVAPPPLPATMVAEAGKTAAETSAAARIEADMRWLADDAREGREAGTDAYRQAANYVAARMAGLGLTPAGNNGWFQEVTLRESTPVVELASLSITTPDGETHELTNVEDFVVFPSAAAQEMEIVAAPVVFVGYGVHAPEHGHDDYAGLDVAGKVVAFFSGAPDSFDSEERAHFGGSGRKSAAASELGAIGMISLTSKAGEQRFPWERLSQFANRSRMTWVHPDGRADTSGPNIRGTAALNPAISELLFTDAEQSFEEVRNDVDAEGVNPKAFALGTSVSMKGAVTQKDVMSPNVIGMIPGSDPARRNEYVVLSAHLDHVGVNERLVEEGKDGINNGALDNAAGVSTMLEAARRMLEGPRPARSVLFIALTAEEKGLLGADFFAHYPTVAKDGIAANVNLDMPVLLYSFTDVVAFGAERSSLGPIVEAAAGKIGVTLSPDPMPEQGLFTRSDHYRFVEQGVPSVFLVTGFANGGAEKFGEFLQTNYHKPSDDMSQPILFEDAARFADVNYMIALELANAKERPTWNDGDFFGDLFGKK